MEGVFICLFHHFFVGILDCFFLEILFIIENKIYKFTNFICDIFY